MAPLLAPLVPLLLACADPAPPAVERAPEPAPENRVLHPPDPIAPPNDLPSIEGASHHGVAGRGSAEGAASRPSARDEIVRVVKENRPRIQGCAEEALARDPGTVGTVTLGWAVSKGRVLDAHVVSDTTGDAQLQECMLRVAGTLRFDPWVTARVARYPWVISPSR